MRKTLTALTLALICLGSSAYAMNSSEFATALDELMSVNNAQLVDEFKGKCPLCVVEGQKSRVVVLDYSIEKLDCGGGYYDEDGFFQVPYPCHTTTTYFKCSRGHYFKDVTP